MLDVFDIFLSAHNQQGHLKTERTLSALCIETTVL